MSIDKNTPVTFHGPNGNVKTTLGAALQAAGLVPNDPVPTKGGKNRRIVTVGGPASIQDLMKQVSALKPATEKPSVIVSAKKGENHTAVTIVITKETIPGDESKTEYLCMSRIRLQSAGNFTPDNKMNFGFDRSFSFHNGKARGSEWKLKKSVREVEGVKGTFWCRYIPVDDVELLLKGIRENFQGATLVIEGKRSTL